ncbi:fatty acid-binding protein, putative [Pediculus humanus corporis]|uniref:Fatty acid-binding protein, putative n=1 Tax=Pediculus humanus subsp. corporis TaxID=121224 RepID=E0VXH8_PEDHC|nr:fatty acid-binding protein, putative [Pediculus humanus corporis]EEB18084.1 fatty acid-binding protein, putative [Pediculus humanus corporis]
MDKKIYTKTYRLIKSDNYDAFLREVGAGPLKRKQEVRERPTIQLRQYGNDYVLTMASEHQTKNVKFRPSEKFVQEGYDGNYVQTIMSFENGNILVEMQMGAKPVTILREFFVNGVMEMMMCEKTVCCRVYSSSE